LHERTCVRYAAAFVIRLARASLAELESILRHAATGGADLDRADYPSGCEPAAGPVRFEVRANGALVVRVDSTEYATGDFALTMLFGRGVCVFGSVRHFHGFCRGPLATAFGLEPVEPETAAGEDDDEAVIPGGAPSAVRVRRRRLTAERLAARLARDIHGQEAALARVAAVVSAQLAKTRPAVPGSVMLLGPTGVGKTATVEALPRALARLGRSDAHVHRVDCAELADGIQLTRVLGVAPGYHGHTTSTALLDALQRPGTIVLFDEIEKAHRELQDALLAVLDAGRLTAPTGKVVECTHALIVFSSNLAVEELMERLGDVPLEDRATVTRICRAHLVDHGLRPELVGRIGAFAVYGELDAAALRGAAETAIETLAAEYGLRLESIDPVIADVVLDLADGSGAGARGLRHAARDLLAECMADRAEAASDARWAVTAGPPVELVAV